MKEKIHFVNVKNEKMGDLIFNEVFINSTGGREECSNENIFNMLFYFIVFFLNFFFIKQLFHLNDVSCLYTEYLVGLSSI